MALSTSAALSPSPVSHSARFADPSCVYHCRRWTNPPIPPLCWSVPRPVPYRATGAPIGCHPPRPRPRTLDGDTSLSRSSLPCRPAGSHSQRCSGSLLGFLLRSCCSRRSPLASRHGGVCGPVGQPHLGPDATFTGHQHGYQQMDLLPQAHLGWLARHLQGSLGTLRLHSASQSGLRHDLQSRHQVFHRSGHSLPRPLPELAVHQLDIKNVFLHSTLIETV
jgi:hypothetical protein